METKRLFGVLLMVTACGIVFMPPWMPRLWIRELEYQQPYSEFMAVVDSAAHVDYGMAYPLTYEFAIPSTESNLRGWRRTGSTWTELAQLTGVFNGMEVARFDYASNRAYLSVSTPADNDTFYMRITRGNGELVDASYLGVPKYYDNRVCAVVCPVSIAVGEQEKYDSLSIIIDELCGRGLVVSLAMVVDGLAQTGNDDTLSCKWDSIQTWIDRYPNLVSIMNGGMNARIIGHTEYASTHSEKCMLANEHVGPNNCTDSTSMFDVQHLPTKRSLRGLVMMNTTDGSSWHITDSGDTSMYFSGQGYGGEETDWDFWWDEQAEMTRGDIGELWLYKDEIIDSRDSIKANLSLPWKRGTSEYLLAYRSSWTERSYESGRETLGVANFLVEFSGMSPWNNARVQYATWAAEYGTFNRQGCTFYFGQSGIGLDTANARFDTRYTWHGIHAPRISYTGGVRQDWWGDHLDYIANRPDVWYVDVGNLYAHHAADTLEWVVVSKMIGEEMVGNGECVPPAVKSLVANPDTTFCPVSFRTDRLATYQFRYKKFDAGSWYYEPDLKAGIGVFFLDTLTGLTTEHVKYYVQAQTCLPEDTTCCSAWKADSFYTECEAYTYQNVEAAGTITDASITWETQTATTSEYMIHRAGDPNWIGIEYEALQMSHELSITDFFELREGYIYEYKVRGYNACGWTNGWSTAKFFIVTDGVLAPYAE